MLIAEYYAKIQLLGFEIDSYVISDGVACLSDVGASRLLRFDTHSVLNNLVSNKGPKEIKSLIGKDLTVSQTVLVTANGHRSEVISTKEARMPHILASFIRSTIA